MKISRPLTSSRLVSHASFRRSNRRAGLTVLELVSALALFIIILGTLLIALNSATDIWTRSANKNRDMQKVRQALDMIATDLTCAVAPRSLNSGSTPPPSSTSATDPEPLFRVSTKGNLSNVDQIGLYFIKMLSPTDMTDPKQLSMEFVAYSLTTNGLSRYTRPVQAETMRTDPPDLNNQLELFENTVTAIPTPSNILSSAIVEFAPLVYQPLRNSSTTASQAPVYYLPVNSVRLADLPDFLDILIAYVDKNDWANSTSKTNYMTRRITLPAAQASRLP